MPSSYMRQKREEKKENENREQHPLPYPDQVEW